MNVPITDTALIVTAIVVVLYFVYLWRLGAPARKRRYIERQYQNGYNWAWTEMCRTNGKAAETIDEHCASPWAGPFERGCAAALYAYELNAVTGEPHDH